jgi:hypothetical protein
MKMSILLIEEVIKLINKGLYGRIDTRVMSKMQDVFQITSKLDVEVESLLKKVKKVSKGLGIEYQIQKWREDFIDPMLGNIPG